MADNEEALYDDNDIPSMIGEDSVTPGQTARVKVGPDTGGVQVEEVPKSDLEGGGKTSVGTSPVEITFTGETKSVVITADIDNTGTLYIGKSDVTNTGANAMRPLESGESMVLEYNDSSNPLYVVASIASQNFFKGALL